MEAADRNLLSCPVVLLPTGTVQSAGGGLDQPGHLRSWVGDDWEPVDFTTVPFLTREQWDTIGMIPVQYHSDVWVSIRGRQLGIGTVLRTGSVFVHHNEPAGRLSTHHEDYQTFQRTLQEAAA